MSQNMPQYPSTGANLQTLLVAGGADPLAQVETLKTVVCPVCRALYVPLGEQQNRYSTGLLETAFLEVCHHCFRCRRPACPQCWNPVHHTCASCCEEARLPFRGPVPALEGLVFLPSTPAGSTPTEQISFICQRNGRFYTPEPAPPGSVAPATGSPAPADGTRVTSDALPELEQAPDPAPAPASAHNDAYPTWLQEVLGQKTQGQTAPVPVNSEQSTGQTSTIPVINAAPVSWSQAGQANRPHLVPIGPRQEASPEAPELPPPTAQPLPAHASTPEPQDTDAVPQTPESGEEVSLFERLENALIIFTSFLLLTVVLMIVLSICLSQVNAFFLMTLHIDIRTEIAYLLQLR